MTNSVGTSGQGGARQVAVGCEPAVVLGVGDRLLDDDEPALRFTCDEARRRRLRIRLVHGCEPLLTATALAPTESLETRGQRAAEVLDSMSRHLMAWMGHGSVIECELYAGTSVAALTAASERADLVVVHRRRVGPIRRLHTGSTTSRLIAKSAAPVAVVHDQVGDIRGPVIAVVPAGQTSTDVVHAAAEEAALRACPLQVVVPLSEPLPPSAAEVTGTVVRVEEVNDDVLKRLGAEAQLLVLGPPARPVHGEFGLGHHLRHALASCGCPLMIIPPPTRPPRRGASDQPIAAWRSQPDESSRPAAG